MASIGEASRLGSGGFWTRVAFALALAAVVIAFSPPVAGPGLAQAPPTVVEAICLNGGRSPAVCACAERTLFERLGDDPYAQYEAVGQAWLSNPSGGWDGAAADVAARIGGDPREILNQTKLYGQLHREVMRACA
ncbi:MAG: hypothetical protein AAF909_05220 [Pseudomonadota bacterium]